MNICDLIRCNAIGKMNRTQTDARLLRSPQVDTESDDGDGDDADDDGIKRDDQCSNYGRASSS